MTYGGIAQLGERLNGIQEVSGSIPLISTKGYDKRLVFVRKQAFTFSKTTYRDEVGTIHRHSIFSPTRAVFTIRENGPFYCPNAFHGETDYILAFLKFFAYDIPQAIV